METVSINVKPIVKSDVVNLVSEGEKFITH